MRQQMNSLGEATGSSAAERALGNLLDGRCPSGGDVAVLCVEIDCLASVEDCWGTAGVAALMAAAAARLGAFIDAPDMLFQTSACSFVLLLPGIRSADHVGWLAETAAARLEGPIVYRDQIMTCRVRIGGTMSERSDRAGQLPIASDLIARARMAVDSVGDDPTRRYHPYVDGDAQRRRREADLVAALRHAIGTRQLSLVYQPQSDLHGTGKNKVEALLRWHHPVLGPISPAEFIPIAEAHGLILPIGRWVLLEACRQAAVWADEPFGPVEVAVNVSPVQFADANIYEEVCSVLGETGLDPCHLTLEITEGVLVQDVLTTADTIERLRALGLRIAIDDFGAGHSSLAYLAEFDVTELKLDRCFVTPAMAGKQARTVVSAIVSLAHRIGMKVVAEGVETPEQLGVLKRIGCDWVQGYHYARPMPADDVSAFLLAAFDRELRRHRTPAAAAAHPLLAQAV